MFFNHNDRTENQRIFRALKNICVDVNCRSSRSLLTIKERKVNDLLIRALVNSRPRRLLLEAAHDC